MAHIYRNKFTGHVLAVLDGALRHDRLYRTTEEGEGWETIHHVDNGIDGLDGRHIDPKYWVLDDTLPV